ncbi:MAG: hypothetical protein LBF80_05820, partial [Spirochaetaceae bacterium]|nr:hypothetical protein [Spirochaetaceae bacterium]
MPIEQYTESIILREMKCALGVSGEAVKKAVSIEEIQELAIEMHDALRELAVTEREKPVFIAGILIALNDKDFIAEYPNLVSFNS